jgi:hypothetical protein
LRSDIGAIVQRFRGDFAVIAKRSDCMAIA